MTIEELFVPAVAATSTGLAFWAAVRGLRWPRRHVGHAVGKALECIGLAVVFCIINAAVGWCLVLALRAMSGRFVSLYLGADQTLLGLSGLQALVFQWWRESARRP